MAAWKENIVTVTTASASMGMARTARDTRVARDIDWRLKQVTRVSLIR